MALKAKDQELAEQKKINDDLIMKVAELQTKLEVYVVFWKKNSSFFRKNQRNRRQRSSRRRKLLPSRRRKLLRGRRKLLQ